MLGHGLILGWIAPALAKLASADTPLPSGPLTNEQISWIGSSNTIGSLVGSIVYGYLISLLGCKHATLLLAIPSIGHWLLIQFGTTYYHIFAARFIGGWVGGGSISTLSLFTSEIANNDIRGRLGSMSMFFRNIGTLVGYILGAIVDYKYIPGICVSIPILFLIIFSIQSNTPQYYLHKDKPQKAINALKHYKGYKGNDDLVDDALHCEFERLKTIAMQRKTDVKIGIADLCDREAVKGLGFGIALLLFGQFTAYVPLLNYSVIIFKQAGTSIDPYVASIILAMALIFGSFCSTYFADILGRKRMNFMSLTGSAVGLFAMAIFHYLWINGYDLSAYLWTPVVFLSFTEFISSAGIVPTMYVCSLENIPPKFRPFGMLILSCFVSIISTVLVKTFPVLVASIGLHWCLMIYVIGCIIGAIFVICVQKETSGQYIDGGTITNVKDNAKVDQIESHRFLISEQNKSIE